MNSVFEFLPEIASAEESPIEIEGQVIAWHVVLFDQEKNALGGGFHHLKETARRIAIAEAAERKLVSKLRESSLASEFQLNIHPTTCGFAAGFDTERTRQRAIAEAVERWAWSKWIDEHFVMNKFKPESIKLSKQGKFISSFFDSIIFFGRTIDTSGIPDFVNSVEIGIVIGIKDNGVFPGSRVAVTEDEIWDHAFIEAWRHLEISKKYKGSIEEPFPYGRIFHFAENASEALAQIDTANKVQWPSPDVSLILEHKTNIKELHLWRAIMKDFISWGYGNQKRFVY
jgi:hypothetical protein